jgi:hypothetical protein
VFVPLIVTPATKKPPVGLSSSRRIFVTVGKNPEDRGILLDAPGSQILSALERSLRIDLAKVQLDSLEHDLNSGFEALGIAKVVRLERENDSAHVEMALTGLVELEAKLRNLAPRLTAQVGTPVASAVAGALSKATGKYVTVKTAVLDQPNRKLRISIRIGATPA